MCFMGDENGRYHESFPGVPLELAAIIQVRRKSCSVGTAVSLAVCQCVY